MSLSARPTTASTTSGTTCATSTSPSTTPMTMLTSTIAWCTPCAERARRAHSFTLDVVSHLIGSSPESFHNHLHSHPWAHLFDSLLPFYFHLLLPVFSFYLLHSELYPELDNPIVLESLCYSANKGSEDAYDVSTSLAKTMVKRSIEQEIRNKNFGIRNGNFEKNAVVKNQGTNSVRKELILRDCWQWETNGQCVKGDNCSFRHDMNKRGKVTPSNPSPNSFMRQNERKTSRTRSPRGRSPSGRTSRWPCKDYLRGTCNNSFCEKWHPPECLFYKPKSGYRFGEKCSFAHRQVDEQPTKGPKRMMTKVQWLY